MHNSEGAWIGWGIGDDAPKVAELKAFMRQKFSYARNLSDTTLYDHPMYVAVFEMQRRYNAEGRLHEPTGVVDYATQVTMGFIVAQQPVPPPMLPVVFTVGGHMGSMWEGPPAEIARTLEAQGVARWQPIGYDNISLPFHNGSGVRELKRLLSDTTLLPAGMPWALAIYSQGAIVGCQTFTQHIRDPRGELHWRYESLAGVVAFGNPWREKGKIAPWVARNVPRPNTCGISPERMTDTPEYWAENAHQGDLYAASTDDDAGEMKSAIYLAAAESQFINHPDSLLHQFREWADRPAAETAAAVKAITSGVLFLGDMGKHEYHDEVGPSTDWLRSKLA